MVLDPASLGLGGENALSRISPVQVLGTIPLLLWQWWCRFGSGH